jgi:hypothetical protein
VSAERIGPDPLRVWLERAERFVEHELSVDETRTVVAAWLRAADMGEAMRRVQAIIESVHL